MLDSLNDTREQLRKAARMITAEQSRRAAAAEVAKMTPEQRDRLMAAVIAARGIPSAESFGKVGS